MGYPAVFVELLGGVSSPGAAPPAYCLPLPLILLGSAALAGRAGPIPDDLVDAIVARLNAQLVATGTLNWFGTGTSPGVQDAPLPYAQLGEPDEDDEDLNAQGDRTADGHFEVTCYAATKKEARRLGDLVAASLKDAPLAFSAGKLMYLRQSGRTAMEDPDPAAGGGACWDEVRQFRFIYSYA
jgi:hypothetical protein